MTGVSMETFHKAKAKLTGKHAQDPAPPGEPAPSRLVPPNPAFLASGSSDDDYSSSSDGNPTSPVTPPPMHAPRFASLTGAPGIEGEGCKAKTGGILQNARRSLSGGEARGKTVERGPSFERQPSNTGSHRSFTFSEDAISATSEDDAATKPRRPTVSTAETAPSPDATTSPTSPGSKPVRPISPREPSCLKFAPLPNPGPRSNRNSINLGVAARANLLQGQGEAMDGVVSMPTGAEGEVVRGCPEGEGRCKEEVWEQAAPVDDVYTIHDATRQVRKLFRRISSSSGGTTTSGSSSPDRPGLPHHAVSDSESSPNASRTRATTFDPAGLPKPRDETTAVQDDAETAASGKEGFRGRARHAGIGTRNVRDPGTNPTSTTSSAITPPRKEDQTAGDEQDGDDEAEDEEVEPEAEPEGGDTDTLDGDEAERARERSTTKAGGIEKVHKHRD